MYLLILLLVHLNVIFVEENNYIDGNVEKGSMFSVCVLGLIIVFILIFIIWKILNYINFRKAADKINKSSD